MTINEVLLSYARNNRILYLPVFQEAIKAALQADGQTCYWDGDYCSWKSSRFPQVSTLMERSRKKRITESFLCRFAGDGTLTHFVSFGTNWAKWANWPWVTFQTLGNRSAQCVITFCLKTMQHVKGLYSFLPLHIIRIPMRWCTPSPPPTPSKQNKTLPEEFKSAGVPRLLSLPFLCHLAALGSPTKGCHCLSPQKAGWPGGGIELREPGAKSSPLGGEMWKREGQLR